MLAKHLGEAGIASEQQAQIRQAVAQHGHAIDAHAKAKPEIRSLGS